MAVAPEMAMAAKMALARRLQKVHVLGLRSNIPDVSGEHSVHDSPISHTSTPPNVLIGPTFSIHMAAISGVAAWAIWKGKSWARRWAIAASLMYILIFLRQFIIPVRPAWDHHVGALFVGLLGLVSFVWRN